MSVLGWHMVYVQLHASITLFLMFLFFPPKSPLKIDISQNNTPHIYIFEKKQCKYFYFNSEQTDEQ